jgi:Nucleoside diphosphate kinase
MLALILFKPDTFVNRRWGTALRFLQDETDFKINEVRLYHPCIPTTLKLTKHYAEHEGKDFYPGLMEFMVSGRIIAVTGETSSILGLRQAISRFRIKYAEGGPRNLLHCSDSEEAARREINIWFPAV